jgi:hypothetical protein
MSLKATTSEEAPAYAPPPGFIILEVSNGLVVDAKKTAGPTRNRLARLARGKPNPRHNVHEPGGFRTLGHLQSPSPTPTNPGSARPVSLFGTVAARKVVFRLHRAPQTDDSVPGDLFFAIHFARPLSRFARTSSAPRPSGKMTG